MRGKPNILVIVVDCLRSDRIFSHDRTCRTPNIDKLVECGAVVGNSPMRRLSRLRPWNITI